MLQHGQSLRVIGWCEPSSRPRHLCQSSGGAQKETQTGKACVDSASHLVWGLLLIGVLIVVNAFFVAAEYALVRVRRTRMEASSRTGKRSGKSRLARLAPSQSLHRRRSGGHYPRRPCVRTLWRTGLRRHPAPALCLALPPMARWPRDEYGHDHRAFPPRHLLLACCAQ